MTEASTAGGPREPGPPPGPQQPTGSSPQRPVGSGTAEPAGSGTADLLLRGCGLLVATLAAALSGVVEAFLVPLRAGTVPVPVSPLLAVVGNVVLVRFAARVTGSRLAVLGPTLAWSATVLALGNRTAEGDLVVPGSLVGMALLLAGAAALAAAVFLTAAGGARRRTPRATSGAPPTIAAGAAPGAPPPVTAAPRYRRP